VSLWYSAEIVGSVVTEKSNTPQHGLASEIELKTEEWDQEQMLETHEYGSQKDHTAVHWGRCQLPAKHWHVLELSFIWDLHS
jgi:hypothetical protein